MNIEVLPWTGNSHGRCHKFCFEKGLCFPLGTQKGLQFVAHIFEVYITFQYSLKISFPVLTMKPREGKNIQRMQKTVLKLFIKHAELLFQNVGKP